MEHQNMERKPAKKRIRSSNWDKEEKKAYYEKRLFLLAKKSIKNKEKREEELHKKRMIILDLEQKYWEKKLKNE